MPEYQLTKEIIALSISNNWENAKLEWKLKTIFESDEPGTCLCGHFPIIEFCEIVNVNNGKVVIVGNCCVNKFVGLASDKIFHGLKRVRKDNKKSLNAETIEYSFEHAWISEWERNFYLDIMRKRSLSTKQREKKIEINQKFLRNFKTS